ncbi:MAG TPA: response regulator [Nitrososphaeraceae archaeon]
MSVLYKDYLMKNACDVMATSTTADEILVEYESYQPDFLILDYKLPGGTNGLQAAREVLLLNPSAKIIIMTAYSDVKQEI